MHTVAEIIPMDDAVFVPTPEDEAWACQAFNGGLATSTASLNGQPVTLAEYVDDEARSYRSQGTPEAAFLASQLERIAQLVRWTGASTPADHEARMEVWDEEIRVREFDRGYSEGIEAARRELSPFRPH
jgi:hypothetical protein